MTTVAALFVERGGVYWDLPGVDPWDEARDARLYAGPHPVVAHPPCQLWTNLAAVNFKRYGGEHNRPGNDGGCFAAAERAVCTYGGVLEHPAGSKAWDAYQIPKPEGIGWRRASTHTWVCEVWQSAYGHKARKRTWLFCYGNRRPAELNWERNPGTHQCGWFDRVKPTLGKREASATPLSFACSLLSIAERAASPADAMAICSDCRKYGCFSKMCKCACHRSQSEAA